MKRLLALFFFLASASPVAAQDGGLAAWDRIYQVLSHPRCANCHVGTDNLPMWSEPRVMDPRPHGMNINGGLSRVGAEYIPCGTCHMPHNAELPHGPPGAPNWQLPPAAMQWFGKAAAEVCAELKDPARNGNRTLDQIADHVASDKLVAWAWSPGPGRAPAPYSAAEVADDLKQWEAAGAPCPGK